MKKHAISLRLDPAILKWFKDHAPKGYQTLIHSVLEEYVAEQRSRAERDAGRAQEIFKNYYAQCFWHYDPNLKIVPENIRLVIDGLRKYGGREGLRLAEELCR